ncbi:MAG: hypothetical protein IJO86_06150 [Oscillospiraceae bacterium]|nr:hypothetical protein [Oscillospiraceae bacterium]
MNFFDEPQVECIGASGEFKERIRRMKPVVVNRRLHKSVGSKWGPRKSRFKRFLDFLRGLY